MLTVRTLMYTGVIDSQIQEPHGHAEVLGMQIM